MARGPFASGYSERSEESESARTSSAKRSMMILLFYAITYLRNCVFKADWAVLRTGFQGGPLACITLSY